MSAHSTPRCPPFQCGDLLKGHSCVKNFPHGLLAELRPWPILSPHPTDSNTSDRHTPVTSTATQLYQAAFFLWATDITTGYHLSEPLTSHACTKGKRRKNTTCSDSYHSSTDSTSHLFMFSRTGTVPIHATLGWQFGLVWSNLQFVQCTASSAATFVMGSFQSCRHVLTSCFKSKAVQFFPNRCLSWLSCLVCQVVRVLDTYMYVTDCTHLSSILEEIKIPLINATFFFFFCTLTKKGKSSSHHSEESKWEGGKRKTG